MKVKYANKWYEVAMVQENFGQKWYEIYDEPDTDPEHTDWITHPDEVIEDENTREEFKEKLENLIREYDGNYEDVFTIYSTDERQHAKYDVQINIKRSFRLK